MPWCGFALVGIGAANIVPVLITLAGQEKAMPVHRSVAMVATLGSAAFMVIVVGAFKLKYE